MSWTCKADHRLTDAHDTSRGWPNQCAMCEIDRLEVVIRLRDELIKDMCDEEDACRILLADWDKSDSYGVVPISDVVEVAITRLAELEP